MLQLATPGSLYIIVYKIYVTIYYIIIVYIISRPTALCAFRMAVAWGAHRDWASRGLFTGVAMVSGLVCSNSLLGKPIY